MDTIEELTTSDDDGVVERGPAFGAAPRPSRLAKQAATRERVELKGLREGSCPHLGPDGVVASRPDPVTRANEDVFRVVTDHNPVEDESE